MDSIIIVTTTFDGKEEGEKIARILVEKELVACAQVSGPITSIYRWNSKVEASLEFTLTLKTTAELYSKVEQKIKELHSYDLPEIIAQGISNGSQEYKEWVMQEVRND